MFKKIMIITSLLVALFFTNNVVNAQVNLTAHTASPGGVPHLTIMHLSDVLGEEGKRREYDQLRAMGPMGGFRSGVSGFGPGVGNFDLGDLLGGLFGGSQPNAGRGNDLETRLKLSFEEAIFGVTTSVSLVSDVACSTCSGVGTSPGSEPRTCNTCGGRGEQAENQVRFLLAALVVLAGVADILLMILALLAEDPD